MMQSPRFRPQTTAPMNLILRPTESPTEIRCPCCLARYERDVHECTRLEAVWTDYTNAPALKAALVSAMSWIPNPDDPEDGRGEALDKYSRLWCREMHKQAKEALSASAQ